MLTTMLINIGALEMSVFFPFIERNFILIFLCSNGNRSVGYLQANQVWWKIYNNSDPRYGVESWAS